VTGEPVKFFVGGGWDEPFISPVANAPDVRDAPEL